MKRILLLVVVLVLLVGAGIYFYLSHAGVVKAAGLVPADSALFISIPDVQRSMERWPKTALAQIGAEPSVQSFLSKPLGKIVANGGLDAANLLLRVKPDRLFFAVTGIQPGNTQLLLGFEYFGGRKDLDDAMDRLYREASQRVPNSSRTSVDYKGDTLTTFSGAVPIFFAASHGPWGFISNSEATLEMALDRASGRDRSDTLASTPDFQSVLGHLAQDPDFFWYGKPKALVDLLMAEGNKQHATVNQKQLDQLQKVHAIGGSLLFDGANQKETTFVLYPDAPKVEVVDRSPMALTTPDTLVYFDGALDWKTLSSDDYRTSLPPPAQDFLAKTKVDLKQLPNIFGNDAGFMIGWPSTGGIPSLLFALEVKDRSAAQALLESVFAGAGLSVEHSQAAGGAVFGLSSERSALLDPAFGLGDKFLVASISSGEVTRALGITPGAPTLETSDAFKPALTDYRAGNQGFGFIDTKGIFERFYNMVRPVAVIAGAMSADVSNIVDVGLLPETEAISHHLSPLVYTSRQNSDGITIESTGPITLSQSLVLFGGAGGAAYFGASHGLLPH